MRVTTIKLGTTIEFNQAQTNKKANNYKNLK